MSKKQEWKIRRFSAPAFLHVLKIKDLWEKMRVVQFV